MHSLTGEKAALTLDECAECELPDDYLCSACCRWLASNACPYVVLRISQRQETRGLGRSEIPSFPPDQLFWNGA